MGVEICSIFISKFRSGEIPSLDIFKQRKLIVSQLNSHLSGLTLNPAFFKSFGFLLWQFFARCPYSYIVLLYDHIFYFSKQNVLKCLFKKNLSPSYSPSISLNCSSSSLMVISFVQSFSNL